MGAVLMFDLYLITPELPPPAILERCALALAGAPRGRVGVQLRSKQLTGDERRGLAHDLRALTRAHDAALLVSADVALALEVAADGVQLPERAASVRTVRARLPATMLLGASRHDQGGVVAAANDGATFATLSPIFGVLGKDPPLGLAALGAIVALCRLPLFALGGIDAARARGAVCAGAHGVAVIREVWDNADPARATAELCAAMDSGRTKEPA